MSDRLDPRALLRGQWKGLTLRTNSSARADVAVRLVVYLLPVGVGLSAGFLGFELKSPDGILGGLALLIGGMLAVFAQLASWRERLTQRDVAFASSEASDREGVDEAVTHVLVATAWAVVGVVVVVLGQGLSHDSNGALTGWACGLIVGIGLHIALLFLMVTFKLYATYVYVNRVSDRLNGSVRP